MSRRLLIAVLASCIILLPITTAMADNQTATTKTLANGAKVTLIHDAVSDLAAFHLAIPVSPADTPATKAGIRDVLQQLILDRLSDAIGEKGELSALGHVLPSGAITDVTAEMEYVEVRVSVPSDLLQDVLTFVCAEVFADRQYTPEQIAAAKESVIGAYEQNMAAVAERTYRLFTKALYGKGPLTRDTATILAGVGAVSADDIAACRKSFYIPSRACITIVSPASQDQMLMVAEKALGNYGAHSQPEVNAFHIPSLQDADIQVASDNTLGQASLMIGVPLPSYGTREFIAGQVAFMLLGGIHGRLTTDEMLQRGFGLMLPRSVYEQQPPFEVIAPRPMSVPFIAVHIIANPAYIEDARTAVLGHFAALQHGEFSEAELNEAKSQLANRYAQAYNTYIARAQLTNLSVMYGGDLNTSMEFEQTISAITLKDVTNVARDSFGHHAIGLQMPGI